MNEIESIVNYHAHVYFSSHEHRQAERLGDCVRKRFSDRVKIGRWHDQPIGPHPRGSYQITVEQADVGEFIAWLAQNRLDLTVFMHLNTGDDYADHTRHVLWLGESESLNLGLFEKGLD